MFGADVVSDIYNGMILIHGPASLNATDDGQTSKPHPVWGYSMLFIPFLPMLVMVGQLAFQDKIQGSEHGCCRLGWTVLSLLVALPITALATPLYISPFGNWPKSTLTLHPFHKVVFTHNLNKNNEKIIFPLKT